MGSLTPNYNLYKADATENYDVAVVNANLTALDAAIKARADAIAAANVNIATLQSYFANKSAVSKDTVGNFVIAAGFSITEQRFLYWGPIIFLKVSFTRTGASIAGNSTGNLSNVTVGTWAAGTAVLEPFDGEQVAIAASYAGPLFSAFLDSAGLTMNAVVPDVGIPTGTTYIGSATYFRQITP